MNQNWNEPLDVNFNIELYQILSNFRYNHSNWVYIPGDSINDEERNRKQKEWLLSTNTKRFMVTIVRYMEYGVNQDEEALPLFKVKVNCFIDGDYQHSITQINGNGTKSRYNNILNKNMTIHYSYVVFDFNTANEIQNSITVTDVNKVPSSGLFTLTLQDSYDKYLTYLPHNTYIRFSIIGSGIDTSHYYPVIQKTTINDYIFDIIKDINLGKMVGYTRTTPLSFNLDTGESYPENEYYPRNVILPVKPVNISETISDVYISYNHPESNPIINTFYDNILDYIPHECFLLVDEPNFLVTIKRFWGGSTPTGNYTSLSDRRNSNFLTFNYNRNWTARFNVDYPWSINSNNIILLQKRKNAFNIWGEIDYNNRTYKDCPLILPQLISTTSSNRPFDYGIVSNVGKIYFNFYQDLNYALTYYTETSGSGDLYYIWIKELPLPLSMNCYTSDLLTEYDIEVNNWNSDSNHNIFIEFIF